MVKILKALLQSVCCFTQYSLYSIVKLLLVKGKAVPLQAWTGPEGCRRLRLTDFKTIGT